MLKQSVHHGQREGEVQWGQRIFFEGAWWHPSRDELPGGSFEDTLTHCICDVEGQRKRIEEGVARFFAYGHECREGQDQTVWVPGTEQDHKVDLSLTCCSCEDYYYTCRKRGWICLHIVMAFLFKATTKAQRRKERIRRKEQMKKGAA